MISLAKKRRFAAAMRAKPTKHEKILGRVLDAGCAGTVFKSQVILHGWIADYYAPAARLLVEVDGKSHESPRARTADAFRDRTLASHGYRTLRFTHNEIVNSLPAVVESISRVAAERTYGD